MRKPAAKSAAPATHPDLDFLAQFPGVPADEALIEWCLADETTYYTHRQLHAVSRALHGNAQEDNLHATRLHLEALGLILQGSDRPIVTHVPRGYTSWDHNLWAHPDMRTHGGAGVNPEGGLRWGGPLR